MALPMPVVGRADDAHAGARRNHARSRQCRRRAGIDPGVPIHDHRATGTDPDQESVRGRVQATAIPEGAAIDADKIPGNVQTLSAADLSRNGSASMTQAMNTQLGSINIDDNLNGPFQPDILYRGFETSPVLGTSQGLAVYQNGGRINEVFGDTVNWDLFPDIAINRVNLVSSNPVYGLNALGGTVSIDMKNGFNYTGGDLSLADGSFGQRSAAAEYGANSGTFGIYVAARRLDEDGWRKFSSTALRQFYTDLSTRTERLSVDLSYTYADNQLDGQGSTPVQELVTDRSRGFYRPAGKRQSSGFPDLECFPESCRPLVAARRPVLSPIYAGCIQRQHDQLHRLHDRSAGRLSVPIRQAHPSHQCGGAKSAGYLR
ncbi:MAG: hypothetical protein EPN69_10745 [Rhodanobacter sp.]|nr:MAG: hypothetical protein EPN69_10745 [Rhodanobacter sp.]TAM01659.1 MAG: hypothetical protein EPN71_05375 [Rhodanobacter sp.]TAM37996.1 MAG: hypothetical protein EPN58_18190 [Rhodanobacter sp.]